ncbi:hypothetical protein [Halalkalibacter nanhaiisediminis]|uniref:Uncharacterized protein n=1 Tax=Halalkalibacter nanhaiisediminis TaxID=688079 RepID=A0A562QTE2_9BACI|nr:hypothetical protein [Halalkalibacter nanhaiisediminis]TWI60032.1 hypothetical protein IQ10_00456 [Halalkalibacter nanhaiisediminis]
MNNFKENGYNVFDLNDKLSPTFLEKELKIIQESFTLGIRSVILIDFQPTIVPEAQEQKMNESILVAV